MPSSLDRYSTNGVKRSVTPEPFSAGITAKVISGYFAFQSSADADVVNASAAAPARTMRRVIMMYPLVVVTPIGRLQACNGRPVLKRLLRPRLRCRAPERLNRR